MDETFRMLGALHEADLEREAQKRRLADLVVQPPRPTAPLRKTKRMQVLRFLRAKEA